MSFFIKGAERFIETENPGSNCEGTPQGVTEFGVPLAGAGRVSGYSCRNVYGKTSGKLSRHANGLAIDVPVFRLSDGREIEVRKFWRTATPEGRFLAAAHVSACRWFNTVLGPDYNSAHRDHFHVDIGPTGICK